MLPTASSEARRSEASSAPASGWGKFEDERTAFHVVSPILRLLQFLALVASFSTLIEASANGLGYLDYTAFTYLVAAAVLVAFWSFVMLFIDCVLLIVGKTANFIILKHILLKLDYIAASFVLSAAAAGAGITMLNDSENTLYPNALCAWGSPFTSFCARTKAAVSMAFVAFFLYLPGIACTAVSLGYDYYPVVV